MLHLNLLSWDTLRTASYAQCAFSVILKLSYESTSELLIFLLGHTERPDLSTAAILDDPMECSRGERLAITLAKDSINRSSNRSTTGKLEVDIFELLRDSEYEMGETMCQILSKGVVAVLGPSASPASNSIISNICGEKEVSTSSHFDWLYFACHNSTVCHGTICFIITLILRPCLTLVNDSSQCHSSQNFFHHFLSYCLNFQRGLNRFPKLSPRDPKVCTFSFLPYTAVSNNQLIIKTCTPWDPEDQVWETLP
uniref:Receptor ligand binding region domain-containing protein n=1 Tax=Hucho hucho TaxID=62062 RepID=A0A4W5NUA2_9TELE